MARKFGVLVPTNALIFSLLAIAFSFLAYVKRIKQDDVTIFNNDACLYPSGSPASALGIVAALALLAAQITISVGMRCFCCCGVRCSSRCKATIAIILYIISWLSFIIAFVALIYTAILNNHKYLAKHHPRTSNGDNCFTGVEHMYLGAAFWCIITTFFGLISYAFWASGAAKEDYSSANYMEGVAMRQPHTPLSK